MLPLTNARAAIITYHCYYRCPYRSASSRECGRERVGKFTIFLPALGVEQLCAFKGAPLKDTKRNLSKYGKLGLADYFQDEDNWA